MVAAWPGSELARAWCRRACVASVSIAPELFLVFSWEMDVRDHPLGCYFMKLFSSSFLSLINFTSHTAVRSWDT